MTKHQTLPEGPELKTYKICVHDLADYTLCEWVKGVYTWAIEEGRLTLRDGNGEYLAIFHQWLYFMLDHGPDEGRYLTWTLRYE